MEVPDWYWDHIQPLYQWLLLGHLPQEGGILDQTDWYYVLVPIVKRMLDADARKRMEEATARR